MKLTISAPLIQEVDTPLPVESSPPSRRQMLHAAWTSLIERFDRHFPLEWVGHLTFADAVHPEQANRRFNRWWRFVNIEAFGKRYRERGEGAFCIRASEYQTRGVLHYHILAGAGVRALRRLSFMDLWASENGFSRIYSYDHKRGAIRYTTKYAVKGGEIDIIASPDVLNQVRGGLVQLPLSVH